MDYLTYSITIVYTTFIRVDLAHHEIYLAKVGKGGIMLFILCHSFVSVVVSLLTTSWGFFSLSSRR